MPAKTEYEKLGIPEPSHEEHLDVADIPNRMRRLMPNSWKLQGNELVGMTEMGPLVQRIPPNLILKGTDSKGLPVFEKVVIQ